jgi:hypothetical protein
MGIRLDESAEVITPIVNVKVPGHVTKLRRIVRAPDIKYCGEDFVVTSLRK